MGGGSSSNSSVSWYRGARPFLDAAVPFGSQLLGKARDSEGSNEMRDLSQNVLKRVLSGQERTDSTNRLMNQMTGLSDLFKEKADIGRAGASSNAQGNGMLWSTARMNAANASDRKVTDDFNRLMASMVSENENRNTSNELGAIGTGLNVADNDYEKMLRLLQAYGGMGSSKGGGWNFSI
mgnify:FL=1